MLIVLTILLQMVQMLIMMIILLQMVKMLIVVVTVYTLCYFPINALWVSLMSEAMLLKLRITVNDFVSVGAVY
jgi:hypothetical protein